ncbi:Cytochrome P450 E-class group I [Penicillium verhagenii]|uniref:Cytochrome P450 E-class group I n=1 Tax=Penicillium verhagenii TaxID=1562060 RepID=UPI0025459B70|nr:Cytochrome P450 E-class group I [Penicillium verhagenii]KAJ5921026.1 Cytochrome P450 E-class group I [Penicillium verhagenii]
MELYDFFSLQVTLQGILKLLSLLTIAYWILWIIYTRFFHPLARFPGPFWASVSRAWIVCSVASGDPHGTQRLLHAQYGPIVRIAPNELAISDPEAIKVIYGVNSGFVKSDFYLSFRAPYIMDHKIHAMRRRIVNSTYTMPVILQSEKYIDTCTNMLLRQFGQFADERKSLDLFEWMRMYAYDVIGELYFSKMFGLMEAQGDNLGVMKATDTLIPAMSLSGVMPTYVRSLFKLSGAFLAETRQAVGALDGLAKSADLAVNKHIQKSAEATSTLSPRTDFVSKLFKLHQEQGEKLDFQIEDVKLEAFGAYFAGSDTTSIHLSTTLYHIIKSPAIYGTLINEIEQATKRGELSSPHISYHEACRLPYLSACIKEGARFHPSVALTMPRDVPAGGCTIAGQWVPGGARVGINPAVVQLDAGVFGYDAHEFNPDRWLAPDADRMNKYILQYGAGSRSCMGKNIALCEMYKLIPDLLRSYRLELENPDYALETSGLWLHRPGSMQIRVYRPNDD